MTQNPTNNRPLLITPEAFTVLPGPPDAPFVRKQCFDDGHVWMGEVTTEPGAASPWHHHGDYDTLVYCLEGVARVEFADEGLEAVELFAGAAAVIPKGVVHREINNGASGNRAIVFRVGSGPAVIPADGPGA